MIMYRTMLCALALTGAISAANAQGGAPGGPAYCKMYASTTAGTVRDALNRNSACLDYSKGVHNNYNMHYDWCMRTPTAQVESAANHIRELANKCSRQGQGAQRRPANTSTTKWSGPWNWVRPLVFNFSGGPGAPLPGPRDVTVRKRENGSFELLPNNRVKVCISKNPCSIYPFTFNNGGYNIDASSGFMHVRTNDQGRTLSGQFWWDKKKRTQTTPDATFVLSLR
ncbi:MAG: hypothetical protein AB7F96_21070 [Beijerinckiaceae bacterium]